MENPLFDTGKCQETYEIDHNGQYIGFSSD